MRILPVILICLTSLSAFSNQYDISARLDVENKVLKCNETVVWTNNTEVETTFIPLHLYMNAFEHSDTVFMTESGGRHRSSRSDKQENETYGYCRIIELTVDNDDMDGNFQYLTDIEQPEAYGLYDSSEISGFVKPDRSIGIVALSRAVQPGESVTLSISFETRFPKVLARTGFYDTFFFAGQWFPKVAVFEGFEGWNVHLFHLNSEFYADFSNYTVKIDVPENFVTGASGVLQNERIVEGRKESLFYAENVIDFAFTTWNRYKVAKDKWKNVSLTLLYQPGNERIVDRQFKALKAGLDGYGELCGFDYPYPAFTLVDVPLKAQGAGGMEYPMLVTNAVGSPLIPEYIRFLEMVIIHEFGHNYFYGILATNEFEHAWMDEGMNSFADAYVMEKFYGPLVDLPFFKVSSFDSSAAGYREYGGPDYPGKSSWAFASNGTYSVLSYSKMAVALKTLENIIGEERFLTLFNTYGNRFKFKHPLPEDFFSVVKEVAGEEAETFIRKAVFTNDTLDFAVMSVKSLEKKKRIGYGDDFKLIKNELKKAEDDQNKDDKTYLNIVRVENRGDFIFPVDIKVVFEDGSETLFNWDATGGFKKFEFESSSKICSATVDPEKKYIMDSNIENNSIVRIKDNTLLTKMALVTAAVIEALFTRFALIL